MKVTELRHVSVLPGVWEGRAEDGRPVWVRYQWGVLTVRAGRKGEAIKAAITGETVLEKRLGGNLDGYLAWWEVAPHLEKIQGGVTP